MLLSLNPILGQTLMPLNNANPQYEWDVFVSHSSDDKEAVARPLAEALLFQGLRVWFDENILTIGDSLRRSIDAGLSKSRYGIVILSPSFFSKEWTRKEYDALVARDDGREKVILPVWHHVNYDDVASFSLLLADKFAYDSAIGIHALADKISTVVSPDVAQRQARHAVSMLRYSPLIDLRIDAAEHLGFYPFFFNEVVPALIEVLSDQNKCLRDTSERSLRSMGKVTLPFLLDAVTHQNKNVRIISSRLLGGIPSSGLSAAPALVRVLDDIDPDVQRSAQSAIVEIGSAAIPALVDAIEHRKVGCVALCIGLIGTIRARPEVALPCLMRMLDFNDKEITGSAHDAIQCFGRNAMPYIVENAKRCDPEGFAALISLVDDHLPYTERIVSLLIDFAQNPHSHDVQSIADSIVADIKSEVSALISSFRRDPCHASALGNFGPHAKLALPYLFSAAEEKRDEIVFRDVVDGYTLYGDENSKANWYFSAIVSAIKEIALPIIKDENKSMAVTKWSPRVTWTRLKPGSAIYAYYIENLGELKCILHDVI